MKYNLSFSINQKDKGIHLDASADTSLTNAEPHNVLQAVNAALQAVGIEVIFFRLHKNGSIGERDQEEKPPLKDHGIPGVHQMPPAPEEPKEITPEEVIKRLTGTPFNISEPDSTLSSPQTINETDCSQTGPTPVIAETQTDAPPESTPTEPETPAETPAHNGRRGPPWQEFEDAVVIKADHRDTAVTLFNERYPNRRTGAAIRSRWQVLKNKGLLDMQKAPEKTTEEIPDKSAGKPHTMAAINAFSPEMDRCLLASKTQADAVAYFRSQFPDSKHKDETIGKRWLRVRKEAKASEAGKVQVQESKPAGVPVTVEDPPVLHHGDKVRITDPKSMFYERIGTVETAEPNRACVLTYKNNGRAASAVWMDRKYLEKVKLE